MLGRGGLARRCFADTADFPLDEIFDYLIRALAFVGRGSWAVKIGSGVLFSAELPCLFDAAIRFFLKVGMELRLACFSCMLEAFTR